VKDELRFLPIGIIVTSAVLVVAGLALAVIATPALVLRGGASLSTFGVVLVATEQLAPGLLLLIVKGAAGLALSALGVGVGLLHEPSRRGTIAFLAVFGVLVPLTLSPRMDRIDTVFIVLLRVVLVVGSVAVVWYLTRSTTLQIFAEGGLLARHVYRYCPICGTRGGVETEFECSHCQGALLDRYETDDGLVFARPAQAEDEAA